jgi:hypothetical protein
MPRTCVARGGRLQGLEVGGQHLHRVVASASARDPVRAGRGRSGAAAAHHVLERVVVHPLGHRALLGAVYRLRCGGDGVSYPAGALRSTAAREDGRADTSAPHLALEVVLDRALQLPGELEGLLDAVRHGWATRVRARCQGVKNKHLASLDPRRRTGVAAIPELSPVKRLL